MGSAHFRRAVSRWGIRVVCLACLLGWRDTELRHKPEEQGRLRKRPCPRCGAIALRSKAWVVRYPDRARQARREVRGVQLALEA